MKKGSTLFLKLVLVFMAVITLIALIWFPQTEGRAANLDVISIYRDPFIIYIYLASTPFFVALYQAFKLVGLIDRNQIFSQLSVKTVGKIKYCALAIIGFLLGAIVYIRFMVHGDDPAGPIMLGLITIFATSVIATAAGVLQKLLQKVVDIKSKMT